MLPRCCFRKLHRTPSVLLLATSVLALSTLPLHAQTEPVDDAAVTKIRDEAFNRSQAMSMLSWLTDVHGPRLTGSPVTRRAAEWTLGQLRGWGLANARLESWGPFGRGWTNDKFLAQVTAPVPFTIIGYPQAWTPGTNGLVSTSVVYLKATREADLAQYRGTLRGEVVILQPMRAVPARFEPQAKRLSDDELAKLEAAPMPAPPASSGRSVRHRQLRRLRPPLPTVLACVRWTPCARRRHSMHNARSFCNRKVSRPSLNPVVGMMERSSHRTVPHAIRRHRPRFP